jgi:hypothetical protein
MPLGFYSMASQLEVALKVYGYETTLCNDRYPENIVTKICWKIGLTKTLYRKTQDYIVNGFLQQTYDVCLIIKGVGINASIIEQIHKKCPCIIGYNFDSFAFHPLSLSWYKSADSFYTFDYRDASQYGLKVVELYSAVPAIDVDISAKIYDISVIQKIHSHRLNYISELLSVINPQSSFIYLYESNIVTMALNLLKHPLLYFKLRKYIHTKSLPYNEYENILIKSRCTIDYAHPKQSGITMRCFEAKSCSTKIITNNKYIYQSALFNHNDAIVYITGCDTTSFINDYNVLLNSDIDKSYRDISNFIETLGILCVYPDLLDRQSN